MKRIDLPVNDKLIRTLKAGEEVSIYGTILTARDAAHKYMIEKRPTFIEPLLKNGAIYHCGPVMKKTGKTWKTIAAGPTTSIREEPYEAEIIKHYNVRIIIGKGGMADKTLAACKKHGAVYVHAIGGAAPLIADSIVRTKAVYMLNELGIPEAFWEFEVKAFKGIITMDSKGHSLHKNILRKTKEIRNTLLNI